MVTRRTALRVAAGALAGVAGCLDTTDSTGGSPTPEETSTPPATPTRTPHPPGTTRGTETDRSTPTDEPGRDSTGYDAGAADLPAWTPTWTRTMDEWHALALDSGDGVLYATLASDDGSSAVVALDPATGETRWRAAFEGEVTAGSSASHRPIARDGWGVTVADGSLYAVAGRADEYAWTALHAVDPTNGEERWSFRVERALAVHGVVDGTVYATGLEFFEPESTHDAPEEPLTSVLYALDAASGEPRWTASLPGVADVAVHSHGVYLASLDRLVGLDHDGTRRFEVDGGAPGRAVRAVDGRVYSLVEADGDRSLVRGLSPAGDVDWAKTLPFEEVLLSGDRLFAGGDAVLALDPGGTVAWRDGAVGQWLLLSPDDRTLYTRAGRGLDRATAFRAADGSRHWTYRPPDLSSNDAWPVAATTDTAVVEGITTEFEGGPFTTQYAVDLATGEATRATGFDPFFDALGMDGAVYVAGRSIHALEA